MPASPQPDHARTNPAPTGDTVNPPGGIPASPIEAAQNGFAGSRLAVAASRHRHRVPAPAHHRYAHPGRLAEPARRDHRRGIPPRDAAVPADLGDLRTHQRPHRLPPRVPARHPPVPGPAHRAHPHPAAPRAAAGGQRPRPALHLGPVGHPRRGTRIGGTQPRLHHLGGDHGAGIRIPAVHGHVRRYRHRGARPPL